MVVFIFHAVLGNALLFLFKSSSLGGGRGMSTNNAKGIINVSSDHKY